MIDDDVVVGGDGLVLCVGERRGDDGIRDVGERGRGIGGGIGIFDVDVGFDCCCGGVFVLVDWGFVGIG